jgi:hypothetical protein
MKRKKTGVSQSNGSADAGVFTIKLFRPVAT